MSIQRFGQDLILLDRLAAGGMAEVFRAKQIGYGGFEKTVAVKRILPTYAMNEEFKAMFREEANLSAALQHSNIVHVYSNGEFDDYLYLVMEFMDGKNIRQLLARADKKKVRLPIEVACYLVSEAAKGLDYAHNFVDEKTGEQMGVVHRDISPQNIMVGYDGSVKVVDFGIAKAAARSSQTRAGVLKGKFGYMSPEQAMGMKLDRRTDVFALGIILFELLTQRRLFSSDDDLRTLQLVKDCRVPRPSKYNPGVPPALDTIVMKMLKKEPVERYATAGEVFQDLMQFLNSRQPLFLVTDLSAFMKDMFSEDIQDDKKKREKLVSEIPEEFLRPIKKDNTASTEDKEKTVVDVDDPTKVLKEPQKTQADPAPGQTLAALSVSQTNTRSATVNRKLSSQPLRVVSEKSFNELPPPASGTRGTHTHKTHAFKERSRAPAVLAVLALLGTLVYIGMTPKSTEPNPIGDVALERPRPVEPEARPVQVSETSGKSESEAQRQPASLPQAVKRGPMGYLSMSSYPVADHIYVNGELLLDSSGKPLKAPLTKFELPVGEYSVRLQSKLFSGLEWSGSVKIEADRIVQIQEVVLKAPQSR